MFTDLSIIFDGGIQSILMKGFFLQGRTVALLKIWKMEALNILMGLSLVIKRCSIATLGQ